MTNKSGLRGVEAYARACHSRPQLVRRGQSRDGIGLYGWQLPTTREVHIPQTQELTLSVHLGGARRVRVYTEAGWSQTFRGPATSR